MVMNNKTMMVMMTMTRGKTTTKMNDSDDDAVQLLAQQRSATAQSKAHRRRRLSVHGSPVAILAQMFAARGGNQPTPPSPLARWVGPLTPLPLLQPQKETAALAPGKQAQQDP